jgi:hypothetical protein
MDVIQNHRTARALGLLALGLTAASLGGACSSKSSSSVGALPADVRAITFLQRMPRTDQGNVFDYTSYVPGARLVMLQPPSADGTLTVLTSDPRFDGADIMSYDLSFDAQSVVFSARLANSDNYQIFSMNLDGSNLQQLTEGGNDYVYPTYLPGGRIFYTTNLDVETYLDPTSPSQQFRDEYERAVTAQVGNINVDGSNQVLGPRNVSHRVAPTVLPDGRVLYTEWRHMGTVNDGHLRMMNADMTGMREAFGGEQGGIGGTNSYLKARYVQTTPYLPAPGTSADQQDPTQPTNYQIVAVATSRDRTLQAGKLFLINLNGSEKYSWFTDMTPLVPGDRTKSDVGRYYDAETVGDPNARQFLVSWADGPVESEVLDLAQSKPNFGIFLFDGKTGTQFPIYDDLQYWDVLARPVRARQEAPVTSSPVQGTSTTIAALNVYNTSILTIPPGSVEKVRLIEGFSAEEGPRTFGTTEFDGQSLYAEIPIQPDNSFAAQVPGNVPFHIQLLDKFAMSIANESIWISGRAGEQRTCGGCHENRTANTVIAPGQIDGVLRGAVNLDVPRAQRITPFVAGSTTQYNFSYGSVRGVPWDKAIQPFLDTACTSCHNGDATAMANGKPVNPTFTVTDMTTGTMQTFTFDLRGQKVNVTVGEKMTGDFTASYLSLMGLGEILGEDMVMISGDYNQYGYVQAGSAKDSDVIQRLNPPQRFPSVDMNTRAFSPQVVQALGPTDHTNMLTADQDYLLILNIDMGGQFFFRENKEEATGYTTGGP